MRIITGSARGCRLKAPKGQGTRPTADRIKESLFNILGRRIAGSRVLDLFAGTGSLGLEALSRGAASAVFVDVATAGIISENAQHTKLAARAEVMRCPALTALKRLHGEGRKFELVFCDPPYRKGLWEDALLFFDRHCMLANDAWLIVEHGADENDVPPLARLERIRCQKYGRTTQVSIFCQSTGGDSYGEGSLLGQL